MSILRMKSLAAKLIVVTGLAIALVLLVSNFFLISQTRARVETLTMDQANVQAKAIASDIAADVGQLVGAARAMAGSISRGHEGKYLDRKATMDMLKANVERNAFAFGSWFAEEPNAFDGQSPKLAGQSDMGGSKDGTFNAYWTKTKAGGFSFSTFESDYAAEWYSLAAKSQKGAMSQPYTETSTGDSVSMTSIAFPVLSGGKFIGVSGVDISLTALSQKLGGVHPFGSGRVSLLSQGGKWVVAPIPDLLMKAYDGQGADIVKNALATGTVGLIRDLNYDGNETFDRVVYPFALPDVNTTWVVLVDVPHSAVAGPIRAQTYMMVVGGLLVLAAVMLALYFAVRAFVQKPLGGLVASVNSLSAGNYADPVAGQERADEIGSVAKALEGFRFALADTRRLEADATEQRQAAEGERNRSEAERVETTNLQRRIVATLGNSLAELSQGNLAHRIAEDFPGEYAKLKLDFNGALESLEETIQTMNLSVGNIGNGTGEISNSASDLAKRTEQQAASLEETAAALNELTAQVNSSAENARTAADQRQLGFRGRRQVRRNRAAGDCIDARHRAVLAGSLAHHRRHRRDRLPDQPSGAQRRRRSRARRRSGQGFRGRRPGSARAGSALGHRRKGDQDADQHLGRPGQGRRRSRRPCRQRTPQDRRAGDGDQRPDPPDLRLRQRAGHRP